MSSESKDQSILALELTEVGLSLFVCEGDVPVECLAHVDLEDPDFAKKLNGFRPAAEKRLGKNFESEIWLPDDQVMVRSIRIDEDDDQGRRSAAASALSASTPFHGETMCFDLGETNGAGYTPVAAVPRDKMDEAMSFAKKMRMNPTSISTSNVVAGFSARPEFAPHMPAAQQRSAPVRMAALAALLAAPILLLSSEIGGNYAPMQAGNAFVVTVTEPGAASEKSQFAKPSQLSEATASRVAPQLPTALGHDETIIAPETDTIVVVQSVDLPMTRDLELSSLTSGINLPGSTNVTADRHAIQMASVGVPTQFRSSVIVNFVAEVAQPFTPLAGEPSPVIKSVSATYEPSAMPLLEAMNLDQMDSLPDPSMAAVDYVQNVFEDSIVIQDLIAVEENFVSAANAENVGIQVANIEQGVLVKRPVGRLQTAPIRQTTTVNLQPVRSFRPAVRPRPLLSEEAFDFGSLKQPALSGPVEDAAADIRFRTDDVPSFVKASPLSVVLTESDQKNIDAGFELRVKNAELEADRRNNESAAVLLPPKPRDVLVGPNGPSSYVQVLVSDGLRQIEISDRGSPPSLDATYGVELTQPAALADFVVSELVESSLSRDGGRVTFDTIQAAARTPSGQVPPRPLNRSTVQGSPVSTTSLVSRDPETTVPEADSEYSRDEIAAVAAKTVVSPRPALRKSEAELRAEQRISDAGFSVEAIANSAAKTETIPRPVIRVDLSTMTSQSDDITPDAIAVAAAKAETMPRPVNRVARVLPSEVEPLPNETEFSKDEILAAAAKSATLSRPPSRQSEVPAAIDQNAIEPPNTSSEAIAAAAALSVQMPRPPARTVQVSAKLPSKAPDVGPDISKFAIALAYAPIDRPASLKSRADEIIKQRASVSAKVERKQVPVKTTPQAKLRIPSSARVATAATIQDGISLGDISLIGIFGTSKKRRALVRLPQGRYVQISRGDRVSGWTVSAVGEDAVRIQRGRIEQDTKTAKLAVISQNQCLPKVKPRVKISFS